MFIEGLNQYQAIKVGDNYVVQLQQGYSNVKHLINGVETQAKQVVVSDLECIYKAPVTTNELSHYTDGVTDKTVSEVKEIHNEKSKYFDDYEDEYAYPDIETQIEILKLENSIKDFKPVFTAHTSEPTKVEVEVVGCMEDTGSAFIKTSYSLGKTSFDSGTGVYCIDNLFLVAASEFNKIKSANPEDSFSNSSHSGLRYAQVNGKYIFDDSVSYISNKGSSKRVCTSLEDAEAIISSVRKYVRSRCNPLLKNMQEVGKQERKDIYNELSSVLDSLNNVESKQKTYTSLVSAKRKVQDLINKLGED